jgi:hypothetical protein
MKKIFWIIYVLCFLILSCVSTKGDGASSTLPLEEYEYTITCSGTIEGFITVKRESSGRVIITPTLKKGLFSLNNENCSFISPEMEYITVADDTRNIIIDGNTVIDTSKDGSWLKKTIDGNTTTTTTSSGAVAWIRRTVDGNITSLTDSSGNSWKRIIDGNTITATYSDGSWTKETIDGNTRTITNSNGSWSRKTIDGNKKITTFSPVGGKSGRWEEVLDSHGNTVSIHKEL